MAAPAANFTFNPIGLSLQFVDRSTGSPTSWSWDFGDGTAVSTLQNPNHIYAVPNVYNVKLTVTNSDGSSSAGYLIVVSTTSALSTTIYDMVKGYLSGIGVVLDGQKFTEAKEFWQLYIAPQLDPPIVDPNIFNEAAYPGMVNVLIAKLVVYELVWAALGNTIIGAGASGNATSGGSGAMKRVETGPSNAEWYDPSAMLNAMFRGNGSAGNAYDMFIQGICMLASSLGINIPEICPQIANATLFVKAKGTGDCGCGSGVGIPHRGIPSKGGWPWY